MIKRVPFWLLRILFLFTAFSAEAQQSTKIPRIGYLAATFLSTRGVRLEMFRLGLRELGYVEGKTVIIDWRSAEGNFDRLTALAAELVHLKVDVTVSGGATTTRAAKKVTTTIPIVMAQDPDPIANGFVAGLARPGGHITGLSSLTADLSGMRLELLKEILPKLSRVTVMTTSTNTGNAQQLKESELAAGSFGVQLQHLGLMSYGASFTEMDRRAATYVAKILKGATPADLPVQQATKFEFVVNIKAAKETGLTTPVRV
jgi:putative ABC transport system substrate-binding protein